jgi:hypothetical protein
MIVGLNPKRLNMEQIIKESNFYSAVCSHFSIKIKCQIPGKSYYLPGNYYSEDFKHTVVYNFPYLRTNSIIICEILKKVLVY